MPIRYTSSYTWVWLSMKFRFSIGDACIKLGQDNGLDRADMFQFSIGDAAVQEDLAPGEHVEKVSILHWRCSVGEGGHDVGFELVSILHWRCRGYVVVGDHLLDGDPVSILHWRCCLDSVPRLVCRHARLRFNSPLEMPLHRALAGFGKEDGFNSPLEMRCSGYRSRSSRSSRFNSPLEMHGPNGAGKSAIINTMCFNSPLEMRHHGRDDVYQGKRGRFQFSIGDASDLFSVFWVMR